MAARISALTTIVFHLQLNFQNKFLYLSGFVEMIVTMIKSPRDNGKTKVEHLYTGPQDTEVVEGMIECDSEVSAHGYDRITARHCYVSRFFC